jgi:hypothetical protein
MTSFEQPDAGLLVEHLLPSLLGANNSLSQEFQERNLFFGELGTALETLHGRLTVISSPPRGAREDSQYPWLWRYVSHFNVGSEARAVQHAKLWAFHWKIDDEQALELHVSSTNLTSSAFKSQLQAGWQVTLPLGERASQSTRRTWGELVPFLEALGASAGASLPRDSSGSSRCSDERSAQQTSRSSRASQARRAQLDSSRSSSPRRSTCSLRPSVSGTSEHSLRGASTSASH